MSDILKCPYCGGILEQSSIFNLNSYACTDLNCKGYFMTAPRSMWQELIRTRKALEIGVDALKSVRKCLCEMPDPSGATILRMACESATIVKEAIEQITALEQKD